LLPVFSFLFVLLFKFFTSRVRRLAKQIETAIERVFSESSFPPKNRASVGKSSAIPGSNFTPRKFLNEVLCLLSGPENFYLIGEKIEAKPPLLIYSRTPLAHQVTAAALYILMDKAFKTCREGVDEGEEPKSFSDWRKQAELESPQFHYWSLTLHFQLAILIFVWSSRRMPANR